MDLEIVFDLVEIKELSQAPRSPPVRRSWVPGASKFGPKSVLKSIKILMPFWSRFWCLLGPILGAFWDPFGTQIAPKSVLETTCLRKR